MKRWSALLPGIEGYFQDYEALYADWGFEIGSIEVPFNVWHGIKDSEIPWHHGKLVADLLPDSKFHLTDDGHLSLIGNHMKQVLVELSDSFT